MTLGTADNPYDLIVVGGGINGAGIARDAVLRGLSVALFEKNDFSTGATWASSGMIHGGVRYLTDDPSVTKKSCYDSGLIQKIAPHLLFRVPFLFPVRGDTARNRVLIELAEVYFDTYDRWSHLKGGVRHSRLTREEALDVEPGLPDDIIGAVTTDEWGIDSSRLNYINAHDAAERGADIHNYHEVVEFLFDDGSGREGKRDAMLGVRVRDRVNGGTKDVHGRITFNATGAWAERFAKRAGAKNCRVRPGKGIHLVLAGRITNYAVISEAIDGRQIFVAPHQNTSIIGTTDDDYWGDLDDIPILEDEVKYLLDGIAKVFPSVYDYRVVDTTVGCRPTLYDEGKYESDLSRDHAVFDHGEEGVPNFMSIAGGKLAAYRLMSEEAVDAICEKLGVEGESTTHEHILPGGEKHELTLDQFEEIGVNRYAAGRILYRHGDRAADILEMMRTEPETRSLIDPSEPVTEAELRYVLRNEMVAVLDDVRRRSRMGCGLDGGWAATVRAAEIFCEEKGLSRSDRLDVALSFQRSRWGDRRGIIEGEQLAAEELGQSWVFEAGGVHGAAASELLSEPDEDEVAETVSLEDARESV
jgi:glycerol-3-phosphate dehydrogenase